MVIFVDQSRDHGSSADGSQVGHVPAGLRLDVRWLLLPGLVRPVPVVMDQVLAEHQVQVALAEDQGPSSSSRRTVPMTRSQMAFIRGVLGRVVMIRSPSDLNTSPKAVVKSGSRSWIRNRSVPRRSPRSMARLRACCTTHAPAGCAVTPARRTRRVPCSMNISTYNRCSSTAGLDASQRTGAAACVRYLEGKREFLHYDQALQAGWPIATGVIEGACRHS